jgi:Protein of unknown function (DUF3253)
MVEMTRQTLEESILALLAARSQGKTICPSEAARAVAGSAWRDQMPLAREAAAALAAERRIDVLQKGQPVDALEARGPIRLRLTPG